MSTLKESNTFILQNDKVFMKTHLVLFIPSLLYHSFIYGFWDVLYLKLFRSAAAV